MNYAHMLIIEIGNSAFKYKVMKSQCLLLLDVFLALLTSVTIILFHISSVTIMQYVEYFHRVLSCSYYRLNPYPLHMCTLTYLELNFGRWLSCLQWYIPPP